MTRRAARRVGMRPPLATAGSRTVRPALPQDLRYARAATGARLAAGAPIVAAGIPRELPTVARAALIGAGSSVIGQAVADLIPLETTMNTPAMGSRASGRVSLLDLLAGAGPTAPAKAAKKNGGGWKSQSPYAPTGAVRCDYCNKSWPMDPALMVPCPICHTSVGAWCKRPSGHAASTLHRERDEEAMKVGINPPCQEGGHGYVFEDRVSGAFNVVGSRVETDEAAKAQRAAKLRANDEAFLARLRGLGIEPGRKLDGKTAERALDAYFHTHGYVQDSWGNWRPGKKDAPTKYGIKSRVVTKEVKSAESREWIKTRSWGIVDLATAWVLAAAKNVGDVAAQAAAAVKQERVADKKKAGDKRLRMRALDLAKKNLMKRALARLRDEGLLEWVDQNVATARANPRVKAVLDEAEADEYAEQMRMLHALTRDGHPPEVNDGADWSLAMPPRPWLDKNFYQWDEDGYTVRLDGENVDRPGTTPFLIGNSPLGFDPVGFKIDWRGRFEDGNGDGYLGGTILHPKDGKPPTLVVTTVGSNDTKARGVGRRLVGLAARLVRGWGGDRMVVHAITSEGAPFWDRLEATGELVRLHTAPNGDRIVKLGHIGQPRAQAQGQRQAAKPQGGRASLAALMQAAKRK